MKKLFYCGLAGLALFEILKVYFIMPMPGSQEMDSIDIAYFLYTYRWFFRIVFLLLIAAGSLYAFRIKHKWLPGVIILIVLAIVYLFNFKMTAESMFKQPQHLVFKSHHENSLNDSSLVIGVAFNEEVKAYPIRFLTYHHQVQDTVGGKPMIITYCSVCRTGRVFEPIVNNQHEKFRLVGMDHFNAMFEDATTKSWWRQVTGEAVAGSLKGMTLPVVKSFQVTIKKLFEQYPHALVMQPDEAFKEIYDSLGRYERGKRKGGLTGTDTLSWEEKSWVIGVEAGGQSKAYDWNTLKAQHIINDTIGSLPIVLILSSDEQSFAVFKRPGNTTNFMLRNDTLFTPETTYDFSGRNLTGAPEQLERVLAYQEFWHSWRTFHPTTKRY